MPRRPGISNTPFNLHSGPDQDYPADRQRHSGLPPIIQDGIDRVRDGYDRARGDAIGGLADIGGNVVDQFTKSQEGANAASGVQKIGDLLSPPASGPTATAEGPTAGAKPASAMAASDDLLNYLKGYETYQEKIYTHDGANQPTVGYGHKLLPGDDVRYRGGISEPNADVLFRSDVREAENVVRNAVKVPLSQAQYDALVGLAFNMRSPFGRKSTLLKKLNAGDYQGAATEFSRWHFGRLPNGQPRDLKGLRVRRAADQRIFSDGVYDSSH